jgi:hypothetical protein
VRSRQAQNALSRLRSGPVFHTEEILRHRQIVTPAQSGIVNVGLILMTLETRA